MRTTTLRATTAKMPGYHVTRHSDGSHRGSPPCDQRRQKARLYRGTAGMLTRATMAAGMMGRTTASACNVTLDARCATTTSKPGAVMALRPASVAPAPASIPAPQ